MHGCISRLHSVPLIYFSIFAQIPYCSDYLSFITRLKVGGLSPLASFFFTFIMTV